MKCPVLLLYSAWGRAGRERPEVTGSTNVARSKCWAYEDRMGHCEPHGRFTPACCVREISIARTQQSII